MALRLVPAALASAVLLAGCGAWPGNDRASDVDPGAAPAGGEIAPRCTELDEPTSLLDAVGLGFVADEVAALGLGPVADAVAAEMEGAGQPLDPGRIYAVGVDESLRRVSVQVVAGDQGRLAELTRRHGAEDLCFGFYHPPQPPGPDGPVVPLAKVDEVRPSRRGRDTQWPGSALVEIAFDASTAERAWAENVPPGLPDRDGAPAQPGIYRRLHEVDFATQTVIVWSASQSRSCPGWLADLDTERHVVALHPEHLGPVCDDDGGTYRMLLAVDRDRLPEPGDLPVPGDLRSESVAGVPDARVVAYPSS